MTTTRNDIDRIGMKVAGAKFLLGTCTDISALIGLSDDNRASLPIFSDGEIALLEHAVTDGIFKTMFGLPAARDGRKILAFVRALKGAQAVGFSREWWRIRDQLEWFRVRFALRYIVTEGHAAAMQKVHDFVADLVADGCDEHETVKDFARAFSLAKNQSEKQLERLWLELFTDHGVSGAVAYFRERWAPVDDATREIVNAAFVAAKEKLKNETK